MKRNAKKVKWRLGKPVTRKEIISEKPRKDGMRQRLVKQEEIRVLLQQQCKEIEERTTGKTRDLLQGN